MAGDVELEGPALPDRAAPPKGAQGQLRPRERLWRRGAHVLGDAELLALLVGSGIRDRPAITVAAELVHDGGGVAALSRASPRELAQVSGIGPARATRIAAAFELGRRALEHEHQRELMGRPEDVFLAVAPRLAGLAQEVFLVIGIDIRNGLLDIVECARGTVLHVDVHPREVFRPLIRMAAAGAVLVHNHPSGDPTPSPEDVDMTRKLREVGALLGIPIIDHVVIGANDFRSIAELIDPPEEAA
jgi:DNA repair protein RadC